MTQSNLFGRRQIADGGAAKADPREVAAQSELFLNSLANEYYDGQRNPENVATLIQNTSEPYRLSWVCDRCDKEHRLTTTWTKAITAQQQMLAMGMARMSALMPEREAQAFDMECLMDGVQSAEPETVEQLTALLKQPPKGLA